ncbi:hypothetical protein HRG_007471 [Hirsutella rhossiliensis]|uniref:Uncharacterized protein n=1 Tax=Hirsutella rhossiliensis TaxID=111463 RepID=A0A9P8MSI7_9HYPO|nr:uncharacterized protein HRG_07471 [Hirsutella rhossiliensis]KAH0961393.1 hypothetical protein HRG_07471 [Hirsutella rhossiliensis]
MSRPAPRGQLPRRSPTPHPGPASGAGLGSDARAGPLALRGQRPPSPPGYERRSVMQTWRRVTFGPGDAYEEEEMVRTKHYYTPSHPDPRERSRGRNQRLDDDDDDGVHDKDPFLMSGANGPGAGGDNRPPSRGRKGTAAPLHREEQEAKTPERGRSEERGRRRNTERAHESDDGEWYHDTMRFRRDGTVAHRDEMVYVLGTVLERKR